MFYFFEKLIPMIYERDNSQKLTSGTSGQNVKSGAQWRTMTRLRIAIVYKTPEI